MLLRTEIKLFLREPVAVILAVALPTLMLLGFGAIPFLRQPIDETGGLSFIQFFAPSLLVFCIALLGFQALPIGFATYRERGILRRLSTTPMKPSGVLLARLLIYLVTAAVGAAMLVGLAVLVFDTPLPRHPWGFAAAIGLGTSAVFAIGLLVAARVRRAGSASALGNTLFQLGLLFGGVYLPKYLLPDWLVRIGDFVPPGIQGISDAWTGSGPKALPIAVMAFVTVVATATAAKVFRWE